MALNLDLKMELIRRFGSQVEAAKALGIRENRLSYIVRGHVEPMHGELVALKKALGQRTVRKVLPSARVEAA